MSTILAEVPTVGQAIRNIVNHFINPLILLASVFFVGAAMFFRWKEDIARRNLALIILLVFADSLDIRRTNILSSRTG